MMINVGADSPVIKDRYSALEGIIQNKSHARRRLSHEVMNDKIMLDTSTH